MSAETVTQTLYFDFGSAGNYGSANGDLTEGADVNNHYWNNITNSSTADKYAAKGTVYDGLVNANNEATDYKITLNSRFSTNGKSAGGGLLSPSATLLGDLAIATATEDYFFIEASEDNSNFTISGLNPNHGYRFHIFASRKASDVRTGLYTMAGINSFSGTLQLAGTDLGGSGINQNNSTILQSDIVFPDDNGDIIFTVARSAGSYIALNAMKVEEIEEPSDAERPATVIVAASIAGTAAENGTATPMHLLCPDGTNNNWFEVFTQLNAGEFRFSGTTNGNGTVSYGASDSNTSISTGSIWGSISSDESAATYTVPSQLLARVKANFVDGNIWYEPVSSFSIVGSAVAGGWDTDKGEPLTYQGNGIWSTVINVESANSGFVIIMNKSWGVTMKHVKGSTNSVGAGTDGWTETDNLEDFSIAAAGAYTVTLDTYNFTCDIEAVPTVYTSATLVGTAAENGESLKMHRVASDGTNNALYECFTKLQPGSFHFTTTTDANETVNFSAANSELTVAATPADYTVSEEQLVMIRCNFATGSMTITPISSFSLVGSATNGWGLSNQPTMEYQGNSVWKISNLQLTGEKSSSSDPGRFIFDMNSSWSYQMKRIEGTNNVAFASDATVVDIRLINLGTFDITLDLANFTYDIASSNGIDNGRISVMGSSVANGQGATDNHGYAYMYGQMLQERKTNGTSENAFYTSGISVNGNNTINLLDRYDDLIHDYGKYVIFGLSLGNEGIHGATDQQAIYDQFATNMQTLITKARQDGKTPVIMNNYTRGDFNEQDYAYVRKMNLLINSWDLPSINLLGAIDNGSGQWADGYQAEGDVYHPNTDGHAEFFYAMPPSLFDALEGGKEMPVRNGKYAVYLQPNDLIEFTPEGTVHSFALVMNISSLSNCDFLNIATTNGNATLSLKDNILTYTSPNEKTISGSFSGTTTDSAKVKRIDAADSSTTITISNYYAQGRTLLYVNNTLLGEVADKVAPTTVSIVPSEGSMTISEVMFYRSALNADEVAAINDGTMLQSSLETYLTFSDEHKLNLNEAQSMATATVDASLPSAVETVKVDTVPFKAVGGAGSVHVAVAEPGIVAIYTTDGRLVCRQQVSGHAEIPLAPGLYLVNNTKVIVK
jgi:hypothetical protein